MSETAVVIGVGAEKGLGATLCRRFAQSGLHVLVAGRTPEKIERVADSIRGNIAGKCLVLEYTFRYIVSLIWGCNEADHQIIMM